MKLGGPRRVLGALALLPLLAGFALASGPVMFVCGLDRVARPDCCCPDGHASWTGDGGHPTLSAACCCDLAHVRARATPAAAEPRAVQIHPAVATAPLTSIAATSPGAVRAALLRETAPQPPPPVPILLAKQSFLA
jgi:hypothetical protein